ncbi:hypothetical protein NDU88_003905 [Pleurodeles waltl]|uniref:Uncharacterized protein n=1 Tax=Pleurodeles waltl TaxID=8319 RepID=A0AAV7WUC0_PLEWA|nr:hypothetical protein NDU88_003905 [Pleurodeles waltl]
MTPSVFPDSTREVLNRFMMENWGTAMSRLIEWEALKVLLLGHGISAMVGVQVDVHRELETLELALIALEAEFYETPAGRCALADVRDRLVQLVAQVRSFDFQAYQAKIHAKGV